MCRRRGSITHTKTHEKAHTGQEERRQERQAPPNSLPLAPPGGRSARNVLPFLASCSTGREEKGEGVAREERTRGDGVMRRNSSNGPRCCC